MLWVQLALLPVHHICGVQQFCAERLWLRAVRSLSDRASPGPGNRTGSGNRNGEEAGLSVSSSDTGFQASVCLRLAEDLVEMLLH